MPNKEANKAYIAKLQGIFEARHGKVWMYSDVCKRWKVDHDNCKGCVHESRCHMYVLWMLSVYAGIDPKKYLDDPTKYNPRGPEGFIS